MPFSRIVGDYLVRPRRKVEHWLMEAKLAGAARWARRPAIQSTAMRYPLVVSLTTHGDRLRRAHLAVETLLRQTAAPEHLILWISDETSISALPPPLVRQSHRGLEIRSVADIGPHTKIIHALREFPEHPILTVDDDKLYPRNLIERLWQAYGQQPQYVHCFRAHQMSVDEHGRPRPYRQWRRCVDDLDEPSRLLFPTGVGGVLYPPRSLHPEVSNQQVFLEICPTADDVWLKGMSLLNGVKAKRLPGPHRDLFGVSRTDESALWRVNADSGRNDEQIKAVFERYDLYERLRD